MSGAQYVTEYRPISICNEMYRIIAKLMVSRFKLVLDKCIGKEQFTFVNGRQILDNLSLAMECIKALEREKRQE